MIQYNKTKLNPEARHATINSQRVKETRFILRWAAHSQSRTENTKRGCESPVPSSSLAWLLPHGAAGRPLALVLWITPPPAYPSWRQKCQSIVVPLSQLVFSSTHTTLHVSFLLVTLLERSPVFSLLHSVLSCGYGHHVMLKCLGGRVGLLLPSPFPAGSRAWAAARGGQQQDGQRLMATGSPSVVL